MPFPLDGLQRLHLSRLLASHPPPKVVAAAIVANFPSALLGELLHFSYVRGVEVLAQDGDVDGAAEEEQRIKDDDHGAGVHGKRTAYYLLQVCKE